MSDDFDWDGLLAAERRARRQLDAIRAALTRPDVAALLRGEAVAVPREPTEEMIAAGEAEDSPAAPYSGYSTEFAPCYRHYRAMLAASPFAKEGKE